MYEKTISDSTKPLAFALRPSHVLISAFTIDPHVLLTIQLHLKDMPLAWRMECGCCRHGTGAVDGIN